MTTELVQQLAAALCTSVEEGYVSITTEQSAMCLIPGITYVGITLLWSPTIEAAALVQIGNLAAAGLPAISTHSYTVPALGWQCVLTNSVSIAIGSEQVDVEMAVQHGSKVVMAVPLAMGVPEGTEGPQNSPCGALLLGFDEVAKLNDAVVVALVSQLAVFLTPHLPQLLYHFLGPLMLGSASDPEPASDSGSIPVGTAVDMASSAGTRSHAHTQAHDSRQPSQTNTSSTSTSSTFRVMSGPYMSSDSANSAGVGGCTGVGAALPRSKGQPASVAAADSGSCKSLPPSPPDSPRGAMARCNSAPSSAASSSREGEVPGVGVGRATAGLSGRLGSARHSLADGSGTAMHAARPADTEGGVVQTANTVEGVDGGSEAEDDGGSALQRDVESLTSPSWKQSRPALQRCVSAPLAEVSTRDIERTYSRTSAPDASRDDSVWLADASLSDCQPGVSGVVGDSPPASGGSPSGLAAGGRKGPFGGPPRSKSSKWLDARARLLQELADGRGPSSSQPAVDQQSVSMDRMAGKTSRPTKWFSGLVSLLRSASSRSNVHVTDAEPDGAGPLAKLSIHSRQHSIPSLGSPGSLTGDLVRGESPVHSFSFAHAGGGHSERTSLEGESDSITMEASFTSSSCRPSFLPSSAVPLRSTSGTSRGRMSSDAWARLSSASQLGSTSDEEHVTTAQLFLDVAAVATPLPTVPESMQGVGVPGEETEQYSPFAAVAPRQQGGAQNTSSGLAGNEEGARAPDAAVAAQDTLLRHVASGTGAVVPPSTPLSGHSDDSNTEKQTTSRQHVTAAMLLDAQDTAPSFANDAENETSAERHCAPRTSPFWGRDAGNVRQCSPSSSPCDAALALPSSPAAMLPNVATPRAPLHCRAIAYPALSALLISAIASLVAGPQQSPGQQWLLTICFGLAGTALMLAIVNKEAFGPQVLLKAVRAMLAALQRYRRKVHVA